MIQFEDHEKLIWKLAHKQSRKSGRHPEEFFSVGCAEFVRSKKVWESNTGPDTVKFSTWLTTNIHFAYINEGLRYQRQKRVAKEKTDEYSYFVAMNNVLGQNPQDLTVFKRCLEDLSEDAKEVVHWIFNSPKEGIRLSKTSIRRFFKDSGWKTNRTEAAFQEISTMLM